MKWSRLVLSNELKDELVSLSSRPNSDQVISVELGL